MSNASLTQSGFDFQDCAAIVLFFDFIKDIVRIRIEGKAEDIEITLVDNKRIYSQAKYCGIDDQESRAITVFKDALRTLSSSDTSDCVQLIYATNILRPFGKNTPIVDFPKNGDDNVLLDYDELSSDGKSIVDKIIKSSGYSINTSKLSFRIIGYHGSKPRNRYSVLYRELESFVSKINSSTFHINQEQIISSIFDLIKLNKTNPDLTITLSKEDIIWTFIVQVLPSVSRDFIDDLEPAIQYEVQRLFSDYISQYEERIDFVTKVIYDYKQWRSSHPADGKYDRFVADTWKSYREEFDSISTDDSILECFIKLVLYRVLSCRYFIKNVKEAAGIVVKSGKDNRRTIFQRD